METHQPTTGSETVLHGKAAPGDKDFKKIRELIFGDANKQSVKFVIDAKGKKPPVTIHCFARHKDVMAFLKGAPKDDVDLSNYDKLLEDVAEDVRFFLGVNDDRQKERWKILSMAMDIDPALSRNNTDRIDEIATAATSKINALHFNTETGSGTFNAVREYGYVIPYLAAKEFVGLELPQKPSFWLSIFMGVRNLVAPGKVKLTGDITPASRLLLWSHMNFGHLFANIGNRKSLISKLAANSAKSYNAHISEAFKNADVAPDGSLLKRFKQVRAEIPESEISDKDFETHVRSIVFEFCGAMQILVGSSFGNILATLSDHKIGLENFLDLLSEKGDVVLDEALRLNPTTTSVYRVAKKDFKVGELLIKENDYICLMIGDACMDPNAFTDPDKFSVEPDGDRPRNRLDYLNFGPNEFTPNSFNPTDNTHPCFGQYWARTLLKSMLNGLRDFPNLTAKSNKGSVLSRFGAIPDAVMVEYGQPQQNFVTICSEIREECEEALESAQNKIKDLGNPAYALIKSKLDVCGCIHFMSINVVEGDKSLNEPSHIFMELSVDGEKEQALRSLCDHFGGDLKVVYDGSVYGEIQTREQLFDHLVDNSVDMVQSVWPQFYSGSWRNGLGFSGTPNLSVEQIKDEQVISEFVKKHIRKHGEDKSPQHLLEESKDQLEKCDEPEIMRAKARWLDRKLKPPVFAEMAESPWKSNWDNITLAIKATPDVVKIWTLLLFFASTGMIWSLLFHTEAPTPFLKADANSLLINARTLFSGIVFAFLFAILVSLFSTKILKLRSGKTGALFAFLLFIFAYIALRPTGSDETASGLDRFYSAFLIDEKTWVKALVAPAIVAFITLVTKRRKLLKAGPALGASLLLALLALTIFEMQSDLMAADGPVMTQKRWGVFDSSAMYRWNEASLGQMIFYPLLLAAGLTISIFSFNSSFPWLQNLRTRWIYSWLFIGLFSLIFVTSFASSALPGAGQMATFFLSAILAIPVTIVILAAFAFGIWRILTRSEKNNTPVDRDPDVETLVVMQDNEDKNLAQNHMISIQRLLPEQWRMRFFLPLALHLVMIILIKNRYRPGFLASVGTVHFARWVHLANTNNFVFVSNYDGSWESYLEDFITKSATGMTGIWSNCVGFPQAKTLFFDGATDGDRFKRWARKSMKPTSFWYSAYPDLTAEQIRINTLIRDGLSRIKTPSDAEAWIDLFGSIPRPEFSLQAEKIQSLMFGGSGNLKAGKCLVIKSPVETGTDANFKKWVKDVAPKITFGDSRPQDNAVYIGFTSKGMALLGCDEGLAQNPEIKNETADDCIKFPPAFSIGMDSKSRERVLGDRVGKNKSDKWLWGGQHNPAHAVLLVYGNHAPDNKNGANISNDVDELELLLDDLRKSVSDNGLLIAREIKFNGLPESGPVSEPFGFVDGISQPILRGTKQAASRSNSIHVVNPGEFILGYKDNREYYPPSPQVDARLDTKNLLPAIPRAQPQRYPKFQDGFEEKYRDLGRNGSYLVIRQLEQNVEGFNAAVTKAAAKFECDGKEGAENMVKAKLMGRWPNGESLISRPVKLHRSTSSTKLECSPKVRPPTSWKDNEFLLGEEDPQGYKCPYGSHIRRSNPRDGLDVENPDGLSIVNRHRILRRGRAYTEFDAEADQEKTGIMFMCLNADIERQFEFIQQTWVGSCKFHGLNDEMDPIAGQGFDHIHPGTKQPVFKTKGLGFTIQDPVRSERLRSFKTFITMRGGGYFFLPGKEALEFMGNNDKTCV